MPTSSIRSTVVQAVADLIAADGGMFGVGVSLSYPGDEITVDAIWLDGIEGSSEVPTSKAGRLHRDDVFSATWEIRTTDHGDAFSAMSRVEVLAASIDGVLADDSTLGGIDGVVWATYGGMTRGPLPVQTPTGFIGFGEFTVECHTRLS